VADTRIKVVGFDELISGSRRLFGKIDEEAGKAFQRQAEQEGAVAAARMPRRSGQMAGAVEASLERDRAIVGLSKSEVPYAGFVEFGGIRNRPYVREGRYLFPTALSVEPQLKAAAGRVAHDEIRRFRWPSPTL
jgi:phage gpG-like protein